ncbi:MAG: MscL family protein, partial [candidate division WOR-3 bacterium]
RSAGAVTVNLGAFMNTVTSFVIVAFCVFLLVKLMNRLRQQPTPGRAVSTTKSCPFCFTSIDIRATRCRHCTSQL